MPIDYSCIGPQRKVIIPLPDKSFSKKEQNIDLEKREAEVVIQKIKLKLDYIPHGIHIYLADNLHGYDGLMMHKDCGAYYKLWKKYRIKTPSIFLNKKLFGNPIRMKNVILHEIGHHLSLSIDDKKVKATKKLAKEDKKAYNYLENQATDIGKIWGHLFLA